MPEALAVAVNVTVPLGLTDAVPRRGCVTRVTIPPAAPVSLPSRSRLALVSSAIVNASFAATIAAGGAATAAPVSTSNSTDPPLLDVTRTLAGGAIRPDTVRAGKPASERMGEFTASLEVPSTESGWGDGS